MWVPANLGKECSPSSIVGLQLPFILGEDALQLGTYYPEINK